MKKQQKTPPAPAALDTDALERVTGGTESLRNVKNFDKPVRDYQALQLSA